MLYRIRQAYHRKFYQVLCHRLYKTPPLQMRPAPLLFVTMLQSKDILMYLAAIKSIYRQFGEGSILIINDGSLDSAETALIRSHLNDVAFIHIRQVPRGRCPQGGAWERLLTAIDRSRDDYVIQVDADTLTCGAIPEVIDCYRRNRSFALGTRMGQDVIQCSQLEGLLASSHSDHIQVVSEKRLAARPDCHARRYIRGCAGFSGFARGGTSREFVEAFSVDMERDIGPKWCEGESEQVASNFAVANTKDAFVLPYPKYANFDPNMGSDNSVFLHFLGSHRFHGGVYERKTLDICHVLDRDRLRLGEA